MHRNGRRFGIIIEQYGIPSSPLLYYFIILLQKQTDSVSIKNDLFLYLGTHPWSGEIKNAILESRSQNVSFHNRQIENRNQIIELVLFYQMWSVYGAIRWYILWYFAHLAHHNHSDVRGSDAIAANVRII